MRDPNDRFIVATARRWNAVLVTCDGPVLDYSTANNDTRKLANRVVPTDRMVRSVIVWTWLPPGAAN
jgi:hypothetical protein